MSSTPSPTHSRRRVLVSVALVAGFAGCSGGSDGTSGNGDGSSPAAADPTAATTESATDAGTRTVSDEATPTAAGGREPADADESATTRTDTPGDEDLDLREANVVGVEFEPSGDAYRFSVTLYHDDDGEDGYADWWQVETLDGERLGRRDLLHPHGTAPFTRTETISVPAETRHVVVRGHDQTHGYGGQATVVDSETGTTEAVRQGPEPRDFSGYEPGA